MKILKYTLLITTLSWMVTFSTPSEAVPPTSGTTVLYSYASAVDFCENHYCVVVYDLSEVGMVIYAIFWDDAIGGAGEGGGPPPTGGVKG